MVLNVLIAGILVLPASAQISGIVGAGIDSRVPRCISFGFSEVASVTMPESINSLTYFWVNEKSGRWYGIYKTSSTVTRFRTGTIDPLSIGTGTFTTSTFVATGGPNESGTNFYSIERASTSTTATIHRRNAVTLAIDASFIMSPVTMEGGEVQIIAIDDNFIIVGDTTLNPPNPNKVSFIRFVLDSSNATEVLQNLPEIGTAGNAVGTTAQNEVLVFRSGGGVYRLVRNPFGEVAGSPFTIPSMPANINAIKFTSSGTAVAMAEVENDEISLLNYPALTTIWNTTFVPGGAFSMANAIAFDEFNRKVYYMDSKTIRRFSSIDGTLEGTFTLPTEAQSSRSGLYFIPSTRKLYTMYPDAADPTVLRIHVFDTCQVVS